MQPYYFLFTLAFVWTVFAVLQDFRTKEVSNWLNFSLIAFALAYRAFYSITTKNSTFFLLGIAGFAVFFILAYGFYYIKAFAGGDAKLLIGYGIILPYQSYQSLFTLTLSFLFVLFFIGAIYSLIYSIAIIKKNKNLFKEQFKTRWKKSPLLFTLSTILTILLIIYGIINTRAFLLIPLTLIPLLYLYALSLDRCMIKLYHPSKLTEGDWLEKDVKLKGKIIKKSVHGLSLKEIKLLRKYNKKVLIKEGIPFTPAFLLSLITVFVFLTAKPQFLSFLF